MVWEGFTRQHASLRATIPVTCKIAHILWMMELFNNPGASVHGGAAQNTLIQEAILFNANLNARWVTQ